MAFIFGLPLRALRSGLVTDSRRAWVAAHRSPLLIATGALGVLVLLIATR